MEVFKRVASLLGNVLERRSMTFLGRLMGGSIRISDYVLPVEVVIQ
ncbi:MAG TPA: hypothetical protein VFC03_15370 [Acidimicrobiales bacterium]|nr:hypothetical protein [Acidimicrobiales bacterium]